MIEIMSDKIIRYGCIYGFDYIDTFPIDMLLGMSEDELEKCYKRDKAKKEKKMSKLTYKGREIEISDETAQSIIDAVTEKKRMFAPDIGDKYWYIDEHWLIRKEVWTTTLGSQRLVMGNCFRTKKEAKKYDDYMLAIFQIKKYISDNFGVFEPDWDIIPQDKYIIKYDVLQKCFKGSLHSIEKRISNFGYLKNMHDCKQLIEDCENELRIVFEREYKTK